MPQNEIANSPSTPMYLTSGRYAGQFVIGDVTYGGLQRANVEKVNGEYQGALFRLTQGLEAGVSEVNVGPDGAIYVGGLGAGGNWGQTGKLSYGLQKLTRTAPPRSRCSRCGPPRPGSRWSTPSRSRRRPWPTWPPGTSSGSGGTWRPPATAGRRSTRRR
ncbi:hypothetical protein NKG94_12125 [Micromonospora sp. M12]